MYPVGSTIPRRKAGSGPGSKHNGSNETGRGQYAEPVSYQIFFNDS